MTNDLAAFAQVVFIDLVLAGDNAVVIGALAANLPPKQRNQAMAWGIVFAVVARIVLSLGVVFLLKIPGVMIVGGALLFWVAWKMWRDLRNPHQDDGSGATLDVALHKVIFAIVLADLSMSLDNVLGVSGAAEGHLWALVSGLILSVALMGTAAAFIASIINKHRWIGYVGLALIVFVAGRMVLHGLGPMLTP